MTKEILYYTISICNECMNSTVQYVVLFASLVTLQIHIQTLKMFTKLLFYKKIKNKTFCLSDFDRQFIACVELDFSFKVFK